METEGSTVIRAPAKERIEKAKKTEGKGWFHSRDGRDGKDKG